MLPVIRKKRQSPEYRIHKQIAEYLGWALTSTSYYNTVENSNQQGDRAGYIKQAKNKARGVKKGFPDIHILHEGRGYYLEVKAPGNNATDAQKEEHNKLRAAGGIIGIVYSIDDVRIFLKSNNIPTKEKAYV